MNVKTEQSGGVSIVRVGETRMMYPMLAEFAGAVSGLITGGARDILIDLTPVTYVDSATIGCFMDLYRTISGVGGNAETRRCPEACRNHAHDDRHAELHTAVLRRIERAQEFRGIAMRTIKTTTGSEVSLDGDLLAIMELLYREVTAKRALERTFDDMVKEIHYLIDQMTRGRATCVLRRQPVPEYRALRERQARGVHEEALAEVGRVTELPRDTIPLHVAVGHPRDALRRAVRLRLRRPVRTAGPR